MDPDPAYHLNLERILVLDSVTTGLLFLMAAVKSVFISPEFTPL